MPAASFPLFLGERHLPVGCAAHRYPQFGAAVGDQGFVHVLHLIPNDQKVAPLPSLQVPGVLQLAQRGLVALLCDLHRAALQLLPVTGLVLVPSCVL